MERRRRVHLEVQILQPYLEVGAVYYQHMLTTLRHLLEARFVAGSGAERVEFGGLRVRGQTLQGGDGLEVGVPGA